MGSGRVLYGGSVWVGVLVLLAATVVPATAYPRPGTTERVSVASAGTQANTPSGTLLHATISADVRHVAYMSAASNLADGDSNGMADVFVHDRETGTTERCRWQPAAPRGTMPPWSLP